MILAPEHDQEKKNESYVNTVKAVFFCYMDTTSTKVLQYLYMTDDISIREKEAKRWEEVKIIHPEMFLPETFVDDDAILKRLGIAIPGKEAFPQAYLKLLPQDFIVEEIDRDGTVYTIDVEDASSLDDAVFIDAPTIYATLVKCEVSTIEAVQDIVRQIGCEDKQVQYAGIKDKHAITAQRISFRGISVDRIRAVSSPFFVLKDIVPGKGVVEKGGLSGNRFTLLLRTNNAVLAENPIPFANALKKVIQEGFYNFYYIQRFGTPRLINFRVGAELIRGNYEQALYMYFSEPGVREHAYAKMLRKKAGELFGDWQAVDALFRPFAGSFSTEIAMIEYLKERPEDYAGAFRTVSHQTQLWVYAVSSWLFNDLLSKYIASGGRVPEKLPLFLSNKREDWELYRLVLEKTTMYPPHFEYLNEVGNIVRMHRDVQTRGEVTIHKKEVVPEGIILQFSLGKGSYATTFLSHIFDLVSGEPPVFVSHNVVDTKKILGEKGSEKTLEYFRDVIEQQSGDDTEVE